MSDDQFERRMEFIADQQAQFSADIQQLKQTPEAEANLWREKHNDLTDALTAIVAMVGKLAEGQQRLTEAQQRTDEQISELTNKQAETDDRLNVFVTVVERYISEHRNGGIRKAKRPKAAGGKATRPRQK